MANRFFESQEHVNLYKQFRIKPPQELINRVVDYLKEKYEGELKLAIDVGCGSGQSTFFYAAHFNQVVGLDVSPNQIEIARQVNDTPNVNFRESPAEQLDFQNDSVQLVTSMAAAHWFDLPKFFKEVERILSPGGVLAVYNRALANIKLKWDRNGGKNEAINHVYGECIHLKGPLEEFASPLRDLAWRHYRDITIPYDDFVRDEETFFVESQISLADIIGEIQTLSAFPPLKEAKGDKAAKDFLDKVRSDLLEIIGDDLTPQEKLDSDKIFFVKKTPFVLLLARKSST